jgi:hypothetical protein
MKNSTELETFILNMICMSKAIQYIIKAVYITTAKNVYAAPAVTLCLTSY